MIQDHFEMMSWERVAFGKVVLNKNENTSNPFLEGLSRVVGLDHMDSESLPLVRWSELSELLDGTTFTRKFRAGQVLFGKRRSYQKKVSLPDFDGICSGDILVFESLDVNRMLPNFLPLIVQSDAFMEFAVSTSAGSLSPRTKWSDLSRFEFLLPSLRDQKDIVEIIGAIDKTIESYQHLSPSSYRESIVHEFLSTGRQNCIETTFGAVAEWSSGKNIAAEFRSESGRNPILGANGIIGRTDETLIDTDLITIGRVGACGETHCSSGPVWVSDNALIAIPNEQINLHYLYLVLEAFDYKSIVSGTTQPLITQSKLKAQTFSLPPLTEQMRIIGIVSSVDNVVQSAEHAVDKVKALRKSILGEVFKEHSRA